MKKDESGTLATVVSCERKVEEDGSHLVDVHVDSGGGVPEEVELYQPPGEDSLPLPGDSALLQEAPGTGINAAIGFDDPANVGKADEGEKRLYSRTKQGKLAADIWLKGDGSVHIEVHELSAPIFLKSKGPVIIDSPDVRLGNETASRQVACVGDLIAGSIRAVSTAPGNPILPAPPAAPTPTGGVPFTAQIISGSPRAKAV